MSRRRRPRIFLRHQTSRQWQQVGEVDFVSLCEERPASLHFDFERHWTNYNVVQQLRRAAKPKWSGGAKLFQIIEYPKKGESRATVVTVRIVQVREKCGVVSVSGVVENFGAGVEGRDHENSISADGEHSPLPARGS